MHAPQAKNRYYSLYCAIPCFAVESGTFSAVLAVLSEHRGKLAIIRAYLEFTAQILLKQLTSQQKQRTFGMPLT